MDMPTGVLRLVLLSITSLLLCCTTAAAATTPGLERQRQMFVQAEQALHRGDSKEYNRLRRELADYPLLPYLEYTELSGNLGRAGKARVAKFLHRHADTPLAERLRGAWLSRLARGGQWQDFIDFFTPSKSTERRCNYLRALIATGHAKTAFPQVTQLWLVGRSQPDQCDPVFAAWRQAGLLTPELVWQRVELAMSNGQTRLARYLKRFLSADDQPWVERWLRVRAKPELILDRREFAADHPQRQTILLYGLNRLARKDAERASAAWETLRKRYRWSKPQSDLGARILASAYLRHDHPGMLEQLDRIEPGDDLRLHQKRILAALENEDWERALFWIDALPEKARGEERWRYWKGRALQKLGRSDEALALLSEVARDRTYYAFLAADRIGTSYFLKHVPVQVAPELLARVEGRPAVRRAHELRALNRRLDARREWWWLTRDLDASALQAAALLAKRWGWHDQAIFTLARSGYWDDLELRFPLEYLDLVENQAGANGIQLPWVLAVMRQESAFGADAVSRAGARGLMQLMPRTAQAVAQRLGKPRPKSEDLLEPRTNIPLGTAYLSQVYRQLDYNPVLATAAYNAGPHRVKRWLPEHTQDADIWVETIPFSETRGYVRRVMAYAIIYEKRLGLEPGSILERMRPIPGTVSRGKTSGQVSGSGDKS
jgi:soluble lytic murein transglycosylase